MNITLKEAIQRAGGTRSDLARIFGITPAAVHHWGDKLPDARLYELMIKRPEWFKREKKAA